MKNVHNLIHKLPLRKLSINNFIDRTSFLCRPSGKFLQYALIFLLFFFNGYTRSFVRALLKQKEIAPIGFLFCYKSSFKGERVLQRITNGAGNTTFVLYPVNISISVNIFFLAKTYAVGKLARSKILPCLKI